MGSQDPASAASVYARWALAPHFTAFVVLHDLLQDTVQLRDKVVLAIGDAGGMVVAFYTVADAKNIKGIL